MGIEQSPANETEIGPERLAAHDLAQTNGKAGYLDPFNDLYVMTADFLLDRGWCCGNGCRHCPW